MPEHAEENFFSDQAKGRAYMKGKPGAMVCIAGCDPE